MVAERSVAALLALAAVLGAACGDSNAEPGPVVVAPPAGVGHWVPVDDPVATFTYTELATSATAVDIDVVDVTPDELDGATIVDVALVQVKQRYGVALSYLDGALPAGTGQQLPAHGVRIAPFGDARNWVVALTIRVDPGRQQGGLRGFRVAYQVDGTSFDLHVAHAVTLCVGEPSGPCATDT